MVSYAGRDLRLIIFVRISLTLGSFNRILVLNGTLLQEIHK